MYNPIEILREDYCPICRSKRSVEAYTFNDKPILYTLLLDKIESNNINKKILNLDFNISYLSCKKCKVKTDLPRYSDRHLPYIPLLDDGYELFMIKFKLDKGVIEW